jgi:RHH-type proline utilization regulon transcriptional repressor/proline dehydrogenase/delta 1-pyrroline-5-carboxylate dehydrogenase
LAGATLTVESTESFVTSIRAMALGTGTGARLRLLGKPEPDVLVAAAHHAVTVLDEPICSHGRVELVRWLREQVVTRSLHRYGNVVYAPFSE